MFAFRVFEIPVFKFLLISGSGETYILKDVILINK